MHIKSGNYQFDQNGTMTSANVNALISVGASHIDAILLKTGYTLPLTAIPGTVGILEQCYTILTDINAHYTAALVERSRHSTDAKSEDTHSDELMMYADDLLVMIAEGELNLMAFNVEGPWEPEPNPNVAIDSFMDDADPYTGQLPTPLFSVDPTTAQTNTNQGNPLQVW